MAPVSIGEHISLIDQLKDSFEVEADLDHLHEVHALREEITVYCDSSEDRITAIIKELQKEARQAEHAATPVEPAAAHSQRVQGLKAAIREAQDNAASMTRDARYAEQHHEIGGRQGAAESRSAAIAAEAQAAIPQLRHGLSLYTHISSITWDTDRPNRAKGAVSDRKSHDIRAFDMDAEEATSFDSVNRLWELIG